MRALFLKVREQLQQGCALVLAVVAETEGSAPRGAGAMMLAGPRGMLYGSVGGGALEAAVLREAEKCLAQKRSALYCFDLGQVPAGDPAQSLGMACGGKASVSLQYMDPADGYWHSLASGALSAMEVDLSAALLIDTARQTIALEKAVEPGACVPCFEPSGSRDGVFRFRLEGPERAFLFGGGHIALALSPILKSVGFRVCVMDDRPEFADPARFPDAERAVCASFSELSARLDIPEDAYAVVVTSGHLHDFEVLEQLLRRDLAYVGVIGSRKKTAAVNEKLRAAGIDEERLARVHAPIGLAIGAVTPQEIAVSIAAEMIAVRAVRRKLGRSVSQ